ncbi:Pathogenesis-related protein 1 [Euphorbia peplus]|nr:Pathogenesis-related protein 1 [Euphorbia peplus]
MSQFNISLALLSLLCLAMAHRSDAQNTQQNYLDAHNIARAQVVDVANITWDATLATYAQNYANSMIGSCNLVHSNGPYGENLAKGSSSSFSGTAAVNFV